MSSNAGDKSPINIKASILKKVIVVDTKVWEKHQVKEIKQWNWKRLRYDKLVAYYDDKEEKVKLVCKE